MSGVIPRLPLAFKTDAKEKMQEKNGKEGRKERIKLNNNGWIVEIRHACVADDCYTIEKIFAIFGHGVYLPIDTSGFTDEQWDIFHEGVLEGELMK